MRKFIFFIFFPLFLLLSLSFTPKTFADDKVTTAANMTYTVSESGSTHVVAHIQLTNTTATYYVSSYTIKVGFTSITNVSASDPNGQIIPVVKQTDSGAEISVNFKAVVAGLGKTLPFTLSFDTNDIASQNGNIWEVNIPGLANQNDFTAFSVTLDVPQSFGKPTVIKPAVPANNLTFTKDMLGAAGISLSFGNRQTYAYSLAYHLENTNVFPVTEDVALPPTTNYQNVSLTSLTPKPMKVVIDKDGNWMATYHLDPSQKLTITADGLIEVGLSPKQIFLSDADRALYLSKNSYWETDDAHIKQIASTLKTPEAIYNYVLAHLTYDFSRVKNQQIRLGAASALSHPTSAVCLEFTDLFIALARASGIPAREIDGYGYTQNTISRPLSLSQDVLHAWPEYYDDSLHTWVMVDPTWGNTTGGVDYFHTLDFDHVAFVVKGVSSTYPVPAGGYKFAGSTNEKDVSISVTQEQITQEPVVTMQTQVADQQLSSIPVSGSVTLQNTGTVLFPKQPITITTGFLLPHQQFVDIGPIPPFGLSTQTFHFQKTPFLTNTKDTITILLDGETAKSTVSIVPVSLPITIGGGIVFALLAGIIWFASTSARRLSIFR